MFGLNGGTVRLAIVLAFVFSMTALDAVAAFHGVSITPAVTANIVAIVGGVLVVLGGRKNAPPS